MFTLTRRDDFDLPTLLLSHDVSHSLFLGLNTHLMTTQYALPANLYKPILLST